LSGRSASVSQEEILQELERIISSKLIKSEKHQQLLTYLVDKNCLTV